MTESKQRSFVKTVVWKIIATSITFFTAYAFTRTWIGSIRLTITAATIGMVCFYIHERTWNVIKWGRK